MSTSMNRLQISLPEWQVRFLTERAKRAGVSMAEIIRQLIQRDAEATSSKTIESIWNIAGIAEDHNPLIGGIAVSERPELYLVGSPENRQE